MFFYLILNLLACQVLFVSNFKNVFWLSPSYINNIHVIDYFFSEELGLVLELNKDTCIKRVTKFIQTLNELVPISGIGDVTGDDNIRINYNNTVYVSDTRHSFLKKWQKTSSLCDLFQTDSNCVMEEYSNYVKKDIPKYNNKI